MKDSRDIDSSDRETIARCIEAAPTSMIVVVHGTYTMVETGRFLIGRIGETKSVVITGAMIPLGDALSDAEFNLGFACAAVRFQHPGVRIAMNGRLWSPDEVRKNSETMRFEPR